MSFSISSTRRGLSLVTDEEFAHVIDKLKAAYDAGVLEQDLKYFTKPGSSMFCYHDGEIFRTCRMRENGNGWHDVGAYKLPSFDPVGTMHRFDPSNGIHSDSIEV